MSGFSVERYGYLTVPQMFGDIIGDMIANGFTIGYTNKTQQTWAAASFQPTDTYTMFLEAGPSVDPLNVTAGSTPAQPWRVMFNVTGEQICISAVATPIQLNNAGVWALQAQSASYSPVPPDIVGCIGTEAIQNKPQGFETRSSRLVDRSGGSVAITSLQNAASRPMSYRLSITSRGFALYIWEEGTQENGSLASWMVVQRPVDRNTGATLVTGKCPVFCVYSIYGVISKFVVREVDTLRPTLSIAGNTDTTNSNWIINDQAQVAISENNQYVTTFPSRLTTPRYAYTQVLDIICTTSADVVAEWTDVPLTVFGESTARLYKAMTANGSYGTNMRVLMLEQGGGI